MQYTSFPIRENDYGVGQVTRSLHVGLIICRTLSDAQCRSACALYHSIVALPSCQKAEIIESSSQSAHFAHTCVNQTVFLTTRTPTISVAFKIAAMSPNGDAFLLKPDGPEGPTRFPQARSVPTNSRTIYVSGIASILPDGTVAGAADGQVPDARVQTSTILQTIDTIIKGASNGKGGIANLIDSVVYLTEMERDYAGMNEEWNKVFVSRSVAPARAAIGVKSLPDPRFVVEVKGVAVVDE